jgi:hypothetical protein
MQSQRRAARRDNNPAHPIYDAERRLFFYFKHFDFAVGSRWLAGFLGVPRRLVAEGAAS